MRHNIWSKRTMVSVMTAAIMATTVCGNVMPVLAEGLEEQVDAETEEDSVDVSTEALPEAVNGIVDMSTDYPGITVKAGQTISFPLDFVSLDGRGYDVTLSERTMPDNWKGYFKGKSNEITSVHVSGSTLETPKDGDDLATYSLGIPAEAQEGTYQIELLVQPLNLIQQL